MQNKKSNRWLLAVVSTLLVIIGVGMYTCCFGVFILPISTDLGISRAATSTIRSVMFLVGALTVQLYSSLVGKTGIRRMFLAGAVLGPVVMIGYSLCQSIWQLYLCAVLQGLLYNAISFFTVGTYLHRLFPDNSGTPLGIAYSGSGIGGAIATPLLSNIIARSGWRAGFRFMGISGFVIMPIAVLLFIKGEEADPVKPVTTGTWEKKDYPHDNPFTGRLVLLMVAIFLGSATVSGVNAHTNAYLCGIGYTDASASAIVSFLMITTTVCKVIFGYLYDHFSILALNLIIFLSGAVGLVGFLLCSWLPVVIPSAFCLGLFTLCVSVPIMAVCIKYYTPYVFDKVYSRLSTANSLAVPVAGSLVGIIYDWFGSYTAAWLLLTVCSCIGAACMLLAHIDYRKKGRIGEWRN